jgi:polyisoprenyl-teichoic acid--peptidoglycan teichoic acid transferase
MSYPPKKPETTNRSTTSKSHIATRKKSKLPTCWGCSCFPILILAAIAGVLSALYFLSPGRTNILLLGIDYTDPGSSVGRSDTNILTTIIPSNPYVGMLSIPRDLWVNIPSIGQNRINTAHFFAEANQPGSGPQAAMQTIRENFGVNVDYYIRIKFEGFRDVFDAMGGVDITLDKSTAGYDIGSHHLTGKKALAFARNRTGSDDFFRMAQGQLIIKSAFKQMLSPLNWPRLPAVTLAMSRALDTNIPVILWPRLMATLLRVGPENIDNRVLSRELVTPFTTDQGANVLLPNWEAINPILLEIFGK